MNMRRLRSIGVVLFVGGAAVLATSARAAIISDISDPIMYDAAHYYAYVQFIPGVTWAEANALVNALPAYSGLQASLATFQTEDQYNWFVANQSSFTSPSIGDWSIAWIGAVNNGSDSYEWLNGVGTISPTSPHWETGSPVAGHLGVTWQTGSYGDVWTTRTADDVSIGNAVIMYGVSPVPEPGTLGLALVGLAIFAVRRRRRSEC